MDVRKSLINGRKGETVCFTIKNFIVHSENSSINWNEFRFYTPVGEEVDSEGYKYFEVPAGNISVVRDEILNKTILVIAEQNNSRVLEILEGAEMEIINLELEGDIVAIANIPADASEEIVVVYKEVTDGN